jgi:hypothetical protein
MKTEHDKERERVAKAVEEYLAEGGIIEKIEPEDIIGLSEASKDKYDFGDFKFGCRSEIDPSEYPMPHDIK